ncbi:hypothetical protein IMF27_23855 [Pseudomonas sp. PCH199]|uniref:hypothetical protein n=1 Tax=unclassified Pseudomonas TaxID=196821 RepID=UPI000BD8EAFD|nr:MULTISPECIES: hypothetical protein [unclassified Pseudomonas]MCW8278232.1 hypothetical protein [Pseudomonas sp. PCH199]PAM81537.1 hypothetical protein CES87_24345 [Pseudomonas sp. ERMR1:02]
MQARNVLFAIGMSLFSALSAADSSDLAGRYYLQGAMEMASELLLKKDGTFAGGIAYGAAQGNAKGTWRVDGDVVLLQSDAGNTPRAAGDISFRLQDEFNLEEVKEYQEYDSQRGYKLAHNNYVLEIRRDVDIAPPAINPMDVFFEFSDGTVTNLVWSGWTDWRLSLPFDERKNLKKIGFREKGNTGAIQWFEVSNTARWLAIDWKKKPGRKISFDQPYERDLVETELYYKGNPEELERIKDKYMITLHYDNELIEAEINPVLVHWAFDDGFVQKEIWKESNGELAHLPYVARRKLQKVGFQEQGSKGPVQWLDVSPTGRWFTIFWAGHRPGQEDDLSMMFKDLALEIKPNCLVFDLGVGKACFRK